MSGEDNRRKLKKNIQEEVHAELWLITYADLITLLLCFFILLFASANVDQNVWDRVKASYSSKVKNKTISTPLSEIKHQLDSMLMKEVKDKNLEIENKDNAINMRFLSNSFYNSGDAKLLTE
jgi:chemotaxis protein MotB